MRFLAAFALVAIPAFSSPAGGIPHADAEPRARARQTTLVPYQPQAAPPSDSPGQCPELRQAQDAETPSTGWYGYQILLADAASLAMGLVTDRVQVLIAGYLVGPMLVHGLHRRPGLAVMSPIVRVVLPLLGGAIGSRYGGCESNGDACGFKGAVVGGGIGLAAAVILDWSLAWSTSATPEPHRASHGEASSLKSSGLAITAAGFAPNSAGASFVLGGHF